MSKIQSKIKQAISHSPLMFNGDTFILLDYSRVGSDPVLISQLRLMESMLEKHFKVTYIRGYYGIREFQLG